MKSLLILFAVAAVTASAYQIPHYIFMNCYDPICRLNDMYGFHCKNGLCSYICNAGGCRSDGLPSRSMLGSSNLIFYGCQSPVCAMDGFYGYECNDGACQFICSDSGCFEGTRVNPHPKKTRKSMKKKKATEKYNKLQMEIESREKDEVEKTTEKVTTTEMVKPTTTTTTAKPPLAIPEMLIADVETEATTDGIQTTVSMPTESSTSYVPTTIAELTETLGDNEEISEETPESTPVEKKKLSKPTTKKERKTGKKTAEVAKMENSRRKMRRI